MNKLNVIKLLLFVSAILSATSYASYYNSEDSGLVGSISGGMVSSQSSGTWTTAPSSKTYDLTAPRTTGGAGSTTLGYRFSFGDKDNWNQFYFGAGARYNILGNVVTNIIGIRNLDVAYEQTSVSQYGIEASIGKYWKSPFYTELFFNPGFTNQGSLFAAAGLRVGYDISNNWSVYAEGTTGGQLDTASSLASLMFWQVGASGTSYSTGQLGLQYKF